MSANNTGCQVDPAPMPDLELDAIIHDACMRGLMRDQVDLAVAQHYQRDNKPIPTATDINAAYARNVARWITRANLGRDELYALHVARREDVYRRAHQLNDYKTCAGILKDLAQLEQQYRREQKQAERKTEADSLRERIKQKSAGRGPRLERVK